MKHMIVVKEIKEVYHQIEVDTDDNLALDVVAYNIGMRDFDTIEEVTDYVGEIMHVHSVDHCYDEISKGFWYDDDYICE